MRYIRTKDGRIYPTDSIRKKDGCVCYDIIKGCGTLFEDSDIIKQADTIEELCDCLVRKPVGSVDDRPFILKTIIHRGYLNQNNYERIREELKQQYEMRKMGDKASIYLAIWTDKGLIYVAKMNDKGELKLL